MELNDAPHGPARLTPGIRRSTAETGARICALTAATALASVLALVVVVSPAERPLGLMEVPWWALAIAFFLAEIYPVHLHFRREAHTLSLSDLPLVLGLFMSDPSAIVLGQIVGAGAAVLIVRRQPPLKLAFNLAQFALAPALAIATFQTVLAYGSVDSMIGWVAGFAAAGTSALTSAGLVTAAIRLSGSKTPRRQLVYVAAVGGVASLASASLALAAVEVIRADSAAIWLLALPLLASAGALRGYTAQRRRHQHLEFLYRSTRAIQSAPDLDSAVRELLQAARIMVSSERAEIILLARPPAGTSLRATLGEDGLTSLGASEIEHMDELAFAVAAAHDGTLLLPRGRDRHVLDTYLAAQGLSDAILTLLRREGAVAGMIIVADRAGDVETFTNDDARLVEAFANHVSVILESDQVREQLRYQAFHDPLTGLPNRVLFSARVADAIAAHSSTHAPPTVLFLDLDDFKTVNDSLGHGAGDELLIDVAERLKTCLEAGAVASRLGGDEFGILLPTATAAGADAHARRVVASFDALFSLHGYEIAIHPTIGIAQADASARTADELLRNADIAMYTAKNHGKRSHAFYEPEMHARARRRQELASSLERGLDRSEFCVHYQPIIEISTRRIHGFEALARWQHPEHGVLAAGAFMPLAEETGLARAIGRIVLSEASTQLAAWQQLLRPSQPLLMSVNLAPIELRNTQLVDEVAATLHRAGVDPRSLMLEITEGMALRDPQTTMERLGELRQLGVKIGLDDFGTGYSSLSHLRELPIDVLKIAKPFVDSLTSADEPFVKAMIQLGAALEIPVVAEGIEHAHQADFLEQLDCALGQGYHYARPLDPKAAEKYLLVHARRAWRTRSTRAAGPNVTQLRASNDAQASRPPQRLEDVVATPRCSEAPR